MYDDAARSTLTRFAAVDRPGHLLVVAGAGYGKTSALRTALQAANASWLSGDDIVEHLDEVCKAANEQGWVVVDDVPSLSPEAARQLVRAVVQLPAAVKVALVSRWPLSASVSRWRGRGVLSEIGPADLAMSVNQVLTLLRDEHGGADPAVAQQIHDVSAGWPALVHLAASALREEPAAGIDVAALAAPGTAIAGYVADEILGPLPADVCGLLRAVADLAPISAPLCRALGYRRAEGSIELLTRTGIIDSGRVVPLVAEVTRHGRRESAAPRRAQVAARWYTRHGPPVAAALASLRIGDDEACARVLADHGDNLIATGEAAAVVTILRALPPVRRDRRLLLLLGDALRTTGDTVAALATLTEQADGAEILPADLAWRLGLVHHVRGEPHLALEIFARADTEVATPVDKAWLMSCAATAHWILGAVDDGLRCARAACDHAAAARDARPLAAAHISLALCLSLAGDLRGVDEHYAQAARFADRAGDLVQSARIDLNRSHHLLADARFADAARTAGRAVRSATAAGPPGVLAVALCNEGEALMRLGRYSDAVERYERVLALVPPTDARHAAGALAGLGEVYRRRRAGEQARGACEEAVRIARDGGDRQVVVTALVGFVRALLMADQAPSGPLIAGREPEHRMLARTIAAEAVAAAQGSGVVPALLAAGQVAAVQGHEAEAADLARQAVQRARRRRERGWLAEALELRAETDDDPAQRRVALTEAHGIWHDGGAKHDADRVLVSLGSSASADANDRFQATLAAQRLAAAGVAYPTLAGSSSRADPPDGSATGEVVVRVFGRFDVLVDNRSVPAAVWQSRKARDVLRILVARRGRAIPRLELCEMLWPDDDPFRTSHRLSVLLSIVRGVAGRDVVTADLASVALDSTRVRVDVEDFLDDVAHGLRLSNDGADEEARQLLATAEQRYVGEPFEDAPYDDWAVPLREEARGAYLHAVRRLAGLCRGAGNREQAAAYLRRLLAVDPYDEAAHRELVDVLTDSGRHGEARRARARYRSAMETIGVRPTETPAVPRTAPESSAHALAG